MRACSMTSPAIIDAGGLVGERPSAVFLDTDGDAFVARAIEVREDRGRRRERHFVLAGSAAVEHSDAKALHAERIQESEGENTEWASRLLFT